ncbi:MAG TPA: hypothetical protein VHE78_05200 [Gemmatimonadaceae bacterium]|nr:hypothetical protein [Gemmatimonadaceae bacterium]
MNTSLRYLLSRRAHLVVRGAVMLGCLPAVLAAAAMHPEGSLKLATTILKVGDSLAVTGEKFAHNDAVTMALIGVAGRIELGTAPTDSAGGFHRSFFVPGTTRAGQYRLVAEAVDGDEVASVDVLVQQVGAAESMEGMSAGPMPAGMPMDSRPTGEPLQLVRARSRAVTMTASLLILACLAAGAALLRKPRAHSVEGHS